MSGAERKRIEERLQAGALPIVDLGGLHVLVESTPEAFRYHLYGREFPLDDRRLAVLEDRADAAKGTFGQLTQLWVRVDSGFRAWTVDALGAEERDLVARFADAVRLQITRTLDYRQGLGPQATPEERHRGREVSRQMERQTALLRELANNLMDLTERLAPGGVLPVAAGSTDAGVTTAAQPPGPPPLRAERM